MIDVKHPEGKAVPLVFDSPHSGMNYPDDFNYAIAHNILRLAEDTYVHELYEHVPGQGAPLLQALFPRSYVDLNRSVEDIDPELIDGDWPHAICPGEKTALGMGLIWRSIRSFGPIYNRKLSVAEIEQRIESCWRPYHTALEKLINDTHAQFGVCYHINCHSMPSSGEDSNIGGSQSRADFVLGDRDQTTCSPDFTAFVKDNLQSLGYSVALNDPYKGAELVRAYSNPAKGFHSLQIEINRSQYMDEATFEKTPDFAALKSNLEKLTAALANYCA